jgi:hypothetical protein
VSVAPGKLDLDLVVQQRDDFERRRQAWTLRLEAEELLERAKRLVRPAQLEKVPGEEEQRLGAVRVDACLLAQFGQSFFGAAAGRERPAEGVAGEGVPGIQLQSQPRQALGGGGVLRPRGHVGQFGDVGGLPGAEAGGIEGGGAGGLVVAALALGWYVSPFQGFWEGKRWRRFGVSGRVSRGKKVSVSIVWLGLGGHGNPPGRAGTSPVDRGDNQAQRWGKSRIPLRFDARSNPAKVLDPCEVHWTESPLLSSCRGRIFRSHACA